MSLRQGALTAIASATSQSASVLGAKDIELWVHSADFVGTYQVSHSFDGGSTYTATADAVVVSSGATSTIYKPPRCTHIKLEATAYTSGTLSAGWGGSDEGDTLSWP